MGRRYSSVGVRASELPLRVAFSVPSTDRMVLAAFTVLTADFNFFFALKSLSRIWDASRLDRMSAGRAALIHLCRNSAAAWKVQHVGMPEKKKKRGKKVRGVIKEQPRRREGT